MNSVQYIPGWSLYAWYQFTTYFWIIVDIKVLSITAGKYPQESYSAVVHAIQLEWIFLQHVTWDTGDSFLGVEKMIHETLLPRIFFGTSKTLSAVVGDLSTIPDRKSGLGLLNTVTSAQKKYLSSTRGIVELIRSVAGGGGVIQCRPPPDPKGGAMWQEGIPGRRVKIQTKGFSKQSQRYCRTPTPMRQKHRCMSERTWYYSLKYSTICYGILGFFMRLL